MKPLSALKSKVNLLFSDIDDTITKDGKLPADSYGMLWKLAEAGIQVVPVTGRPAGWCEMIARLWPVNGVIGENGAFYFQYKNKKMHRRFLMSEAERLSNQKKLQIIQAEVLKKVPGSAVASDQFTRLFDLAIDFCEDVKPLPSEQVQNIVKIFETHGAVAKVSSIHVNGWFGDYDKRRMCELYFEDQFGEKLSQNQQQSAFIGDSPNDEPLFEFFENSVAVANIVDFKGQLKSLPKYVTNHKASEGFVEFGEHLLSL